MDLINNLDHFCPPWLSIYVAFRGLSWFSFPFSSVSATNAWNIKWPPFGNRIGWRKTKKKRRTASSLRLGYRQLESYLNQVFDQVPARVLAQVLALILVYFLSNTRKKAVHALFSLRRHIDFGSLKPSLGCKNFDTMISPILTYKSGVSLSNQISSIGTLHQLKKVTYTVL